MWETLGWKKHGIKMFGMEGSACSENTRGLHPLKYKTQGYKIHWE